VAAVPSIGRARQIEEPSYAPEVRLSERLFERHHRRVFGFCLYQLRDRDEADDAAQTTFLYALRAVRRGVVPAFEAPWLLAIARNVCRSRWDSGKRRGEVEFTHDPHRLAEFAPGREATDELFGLDEALATLAEPQRRAVLLRDWQGLSYQEVADHLGITVSSAETLIFRGRDALARALNGDEAREDGARKRKFGLSSLAGAFKPGLLGGSVGAKVAAGAAVVAVGVTAGDSILRHDATPRRAPSPHLATSSAQPGPAASGIDPGSRSATARHTGAARTAAALRHSAVRIGAVHTGASGGGTAVAMPQPTSTPAPGGTVGGPTGTSPGSPPPPPPDGTPARSPEAPTPSTPAPATPEQLVTTVPAIVDPVVQTTVDTAQTAITTVVTTATPVITAVTDVVQPVVDLASPVTNTTTVPVVPTITVTVPPLPIHVP
jgi:RNA polymerase sigma-70 factor, ECF subfamily